MRELRFFRALVALVAGLSCLAIPVLMSGLCDPHPGATEHAAHGAAELESCWTVEVEHHKPHDDLRFETPSGPDYHLHSAVAWAGSVSVQPGPGVRDAAPSLEARTWAASFDVPRSLDRAKRRNRGPPRA